MAGGVFISYRREDSDGFAGRIYDRLVMRLGHDNVFFDVDAIPAGRDFVDVLSDRVGKCDALVAVIGKNWATAADDQNRRRLNDPNDFVRIEIEAALSRDVPVIPVLVGGTPMPHAEDLPDGLKKLTRRQAIEISHTRFESDAERLTEALAEIEGRVSASTAGAAAAPSAPEASPPAPPAARSGGARVLAPLAVAAIAVAGGALFLYERPEPQRNETAARTVSEVAIRPEPRLASNAAAPSKAFDDSASLAAPDSAAAPQAWLTREDFNAELTRQRAGGNYPDKVWGRCQNGVPLAGAHWSPLPAGQHFIFSGGEEPAFDAKNAELAAQGYALKYDNTFKDCQGRTRHQALWMKIGQ